MRTNELCHTNELKLPSLRHCQNMASWVLMVEYKLWMDRTVDHHGWPSVINEDSINMVEALIEENGHILVTKIKRYFRDAACNPLSHGTFIENIQICFVMRKICARWVPKLLDGEHKWNRVAVDLDFTSHYHVKGGRFIRLDSHRRWEMGPLFHTWDEECIEAVSSERWWSSSESEARKISWQSLHHGVLRQPRHTVEIFLFCALPPPSPFPPGSNSVHVIG